MAPTTYPSNTTVLEWSRSQMQRQADTNYDQQKTEYLKQIQIWQSAAQHSVDINATIPPLPTIPVHYTVLVVNNQIVEQLDPPDPALKAPAIPVASIAHSGPGFAGLGPATSPDPQGDALAYIVQLLLQIKGKLGA